MKKFGFGIDIGGTTAKIGFFSMDGSLIEKWEIPTDVSNGGERILPNISKSVIQYLSSNSISIEAVKGIGVGVPGPVVNHSIVSRCVNLGWHNKNVAKELKELTGIEVVVGNDANVAAVGEVAALGIECKNAIVVTLGTGVGGGIIADGNILEGYLGAGGEIGHFVVNRNETRQCNCGQYGCLEQYVSATGIVRLAKDKKFNSTNLSAKQIFDQAKDGDKLALEVVEETGRILGKTLANLSAVINPEIIIIGGGVSKAGDILLDTVRRHFYENCFFTCEDTKIQLAVLLNDAGIYGGMGLIKGR